MTSSVLDGVENIVGKGEILNYQLLAALHYQGTLTVLVLGITFGFHSYRPLYHTITERRPCLTHYHRMPHFDAVITYSCRKHCEKRRNCF